MRRGLLGKGALQDRSGGTPPPAHDVAEYLDSVENTNGDLVHDDPADGPGENDRLRAIAAPCLPSMRMKSPPSRSISAAISSAETSLGTS